MVVISYDGWNRIVKRLVVKKRFDSPLLHKYTIDVPGEFR